MKVKRTRAIAVTAMLSAVAAILMMIEFSVPIMPAFIKLDISEMPALIASFALGPWWGVTVCFVKNLLKFIVFTSNPPLVGEVSNFLLGVAFVLPAGYIYRFRRTKKMALISSAAGAVIMAVLSVPINYFVTYPMYAEAFFGGQIQTIVNMYRAILPRVSSLIECLVVFNVPFNAFKGVLCAAVTFVIYKRISTFIKG